MQCFVTKIIGLLDNDCNTKIGCYRTKAWPTLDDGSQSLNRTRLELLVGYHLCCRPLVWSIDSPTFPLPPGLPKFCEPRKPANLPRDHTQHFANKINSHSIGKQILSQRPLELTQLEFREAQFRSVGIVILTRARGVSTIQNIILLLFLGFSMTHSMQSWNRIFAQHGGIFRTTSQGRPLCVMAETGTPLAENSFQGSVVALHQSLPLENYVDDCKGRILILFHNLFAHLFSFVYANGKWAIESQK